MLQKSGVQTPPQTNKQLTSSQAIVEGGAAPSARIPKCPIWYQLAGEGKQSRAIMNSKLGTY